MDPIGHSETIESLSLFKDSKYHTTSTTFTDPDIQLDLKK